jgi:hypothetical protein
VSAPIVMRLADVDKIDVLELLAQFSMRLVSKPLGEQIPGSYWGEDEAGIIGDQLFARSDTPLHSILHEACHWVVMDPPKRPYVHTDASDSIAEENATCYLQILLADHLLGFGRDQALMDMDAWGYSFRLGSARAWFEHDATDARDWLRHQGLIDSAERVLFRVRQ